MAKKQSATRTAKDHVIVVYNENSEIDDMFGPMTEVVADMLWKHLDDIAVGAGGYLQRGRIKNPFPSE